MSQQMIQHFMSENTQTSVVNSTAGKYVRETSVVRQQIIQDLIPENIRNKRKQQSITSPSKNI